MMHRFNFLKTLVLIILSGLLYWLIHYTLLYHIFINYKGEGELKKTQRDTLGNIKIVVIDYGSCDTWPKNIQCIERISYKGTGKIIAETSNSGKVIRRKKNFYLGEQFFDQKMYDNLKITIVDGDCKTWPSNIKCVERLREEKDPIFTSIRQKEDQALVHQIKNKTSLEVRDQFGNTPLFDAVIHHNLTAVEMLLQNGANMYVMDVNQLRNPFSYACERNDIDTVKLFFKYAVDVNYQYKKSETALTYAAKGCKNIELVELLLKNGADPNLKDRYGFTTKNGLFRYCKKHQNYKTIMELLEKYSTQ